MSFDGCEICGGSEWTTVYRGAIRDGVFGCVRNECEVARCSGCGADRLAEICCPPEDFYETDAYRCHLKQQIDTASYLKGHDELQIFPLLALWPRNLRKLTVADIGCAGGSFFDHVRGLASRLVGVEPFSEFHEELRSRGCDVYPYAADAARALPESVDVAVSLQVIEHTRDPRAFLADIRPLLKQDGLLMISTPNRADFMMRALPEAYPEFFYRVAHRWYFDAGSLAECARLAGYVVAETRFVHRHSLSNAIMWLRDRRPSGRTEVPGVGVLGDGLWRTFLESTGQSDCIYMILKLQAKDIAE